MQPEGLLPRLQEPYPELDQSSACLPIPLLEYPS